MRGRVLCSSPQGRATAHKEEGNEHFRRKHYRQAVDEYTAGLKEGLGGGVDETLRAVLCTNRAAAHYYLREWVQNKLILAILLFLCV